MTADEIVNEFKKLLQEQRIEVLEAITRFMQDELRTKEAQKSKTQMKDNVFTVAGWPLGAKENLTRKDIY